MVQHFSSSYPLRYDRSNYPSFVVVVHSERWNRKGSITFADDDSWSRCLLSRVQIDSGCEFIKEEILYRRLLPRACPRAPFVYPPHSADSSIHTKQNGILQLLSSAIRQSSWYAQFLLLYSWMREGGKRMESGEREMWWDLAIAFRLCFQLCNIHSFLMQRQQPLLSTSRNPNPSHSHYALLHPSTMQIRS